MAGKAKKNWTDKLNAQKELKVKKLEFDFAGISAGSKMLVATPKIVDNYIKQIPVGKHVEVAVMRKDLALSFNADDACPISTAIFLRIVSESAYEKWQKGTPVEELTPFWRLVGEDSKLIKKLSFGQGFVLEQRRKEGI